MVKINPNFDPIEYFLSIENPLHKQFLALRMFYIEGASAEEVASRYGYSINTVYTYARNLKEKRGFDDDEDPFFKEPRIGRKKLDHGGEINELIVAYRKRNFSVPEIKAALDAQNTNVSERYISILLHNEGFARLPRRNNQLRNQVDFGGLPETCRAPISEKIENKPEKFSTQLAGIMLFLPIIKSYDHLGSQFVSIICARLRWL
jgi:transposase